MAIKVFSINIKGNILKELFNFMVYKISEVL